MLLKANPLCMEFECALREMNLKLFLRFHGQPFVRAFLLRRPVKSRKRNQLHLSVRTKRKYVEIRDIKKSFGGGALGAGSVENVPASYIPVISPHKSRSPVG